MASTPLRYSNTDATRFIKLNKDFNRSRVPKASKEIRLPNRVIVYSNIREKAILLFLVEEFSTL